MIDKIAHVAVHELTKTGTSAFAAKLGQDELPLSPTVTRVVNELHTLYGKRASKAHGKFSAKTDDYPAQGFISGFQKSDFADFSGLAKKLMTTLATQAGTKSRATGGYVLFAHFEHDAHVYLLVAIINNKLGAALTGALSMQDSVHLDLDGFRFAGRVDITSWLDGTERYIGFLKGKGDVADYFKEFLGCEVAVQQREDTERLVTVLEAFADPKAENVKDPEDFMRRAHEILIEHIREGRELEFEVFTNRLNPTDPEVLRNAIAVSDLALSDGFVPDRKALVPLVSVKAKTELWSVEFERKALALGKILYDPKRKTLTFNELPDSLLKELDRLTR